MRHKTEILFFIFLIHNLFLSCSTNRENYQLINDLLVDKTGLKELYGNTLTNNIVDTIYIADKLIPISNIKNYSLNWDIINSQNPFYNGNKIIWNDTLNKVSLNQNEIDYFRKQMVDESDLYWVIKKFNSKKIISIDRDSLFLENYKYNYNLTNKLIHIYNFTKPIYNEQKNLALIGMYINSNSRYLSNSKFYMIILKKEKKKWFFLGYEKDFGAHD